MCAVTQAVIYYHRRGLWRTDWISRQSRVTGYYLLCRQTNKPKSQQTNRPTNQQTKNQQINKQTNQHINKPTNQQTNKLTNQQTNKPKQTNRLTDQQTNKPTDQQTTNRVEDRTTMLKMNSKSTCLGYCLVASCVLFIVVVYITNEGSYADSNPSLLLKKFKDSFVRSSNVATETQSDHCDLKTACRIKRLRQRIDDVCHTDTRVQHTPLPQRAPQAIRSDDNKLLYFAIPKVGCSFWRRVFKVLSKNSKSVHLFDIPSIKAHSGRDLSSLKVKTKSALDMYLSTYTSFMFVRDPFARLFSGYVDKLLVPNPVGLTHNMAYYKGREHLAHTDKPCHFSLAFPQFASYIANSILVGRLSDKHFIPMWQQCNPCDLNLTYVAKMESFMEDTTHILSSVGISLSDVTGVQTDSMAKVNEKGIIQDLAIRTFDTIKGSAVSCIAPKEVLRRLWMIYQIRGFLSIHQQMPDDVTQEGFVLAAWNAYDRSGPASQRSWQRHEAMMEAYAQVPRPTLYKLALAFNMDCRLFDYDCDVMARFGNHNDDSSKDRPASNHSYLVLR